MPTTHRTPPIQYLTAFVAAAKNNSFKVAAEELNITPSAVSQQIKALEQHLGLSLFCRKKRALTLTNAGNDFYQLAAKTINCYKSGYSRFAEQFFSSTLKVSMIPYIANQIVIPRLHQFQERFPNLDLIVETGTQIEDLASTALDAAIRFGVPPWGDYQVEQIAPAKSSLVASRDYFDKHPINSLSDWEQQTLIHIRTHVNDWQRVMDSINFQFKPKKALYFDSYEAGIKAAEAGLGIAIGVFPISNQSISEGRLITLSDHYIPIKEAFYLVLKPNQAKLDSYQELAHWLREIFNQT